jgi:peptidoglycan/LPS O-acetylase OafA/YrhL
VTFQNKDAPLHFTSSGVEKLATIDAARGWAILLVIAVHTTGLLPELPWFVKKITNYGWYGVQLFFIASAFTLLLSWHKREMSKNEKIISFYIYRFLRIAPMYYFGMVLYFLIRPPGESFDFSQLFLSMAFVNAWSPEWLTTTETGWQVVPGGWSISIEFCFYLLFPFLVTMIRSGWHAVVFFMGSFLLLIVAYPVGMGLFAKNYTEGAVGNFLFFWLPNQLCVFALGFIAYYLVSSNSINGKKVATFLGERHIWVLALSIVFILLLTQQGHSKYFYSSFPWLPTHIIVAVLFMLMLVSLLKARLPSALFVNRCMAKMGEVSFSAYVLHFAVLDAVKHGKNLFGLGVTGVSAIFYYGAVLTLVTVLTYGISRVTYHFIETPFVKLGRTIANRLFLPRG